MVHFAPTSSQHNAVLVIITGPPATGKTMLSKRIAEAFALPLLSRDGIKELIFDTLGWTDRAWSKEVGQASYHLLYYFCAIMLQTGHSCIVENNFDAELASVTMREMIVKFGYRSFQINCYSDATVLAERFQQRVSSGERHPGHSDHSADALLDPHLIVGRSPALAIPGDVLELDTTAFDAIDYAVLYMRLKQVLFSQ